MDAAFMSKVFGVVAAVLWLASAVLWAKGASVEIRKNIDTFIDDLWRAAYWNSWAAVTACAAAVASGVLALCEVFR